MRTVLFIFLFLLLMNFGWSQSYSTRVRVKIPDYRQVIRIDKVVCPKEVDSGFTVKQEYAFSNRDSSYTAQKIDTLKKKRIYQAYKDVKTDVTPFSGWANLTADEKDKSILHINYWLNPTQKIKAGTKIRIEEYSISCSGDREIDSQKTFVGILQQDTVVNLLRLSKKEYEDASKEKWFATNGTVITLFEKRAPTKVIAYLVNKYDRNADYVINLQNREFISFRYRSWDFGAITIPFKYRFGYDRDTIHVDPEFQSDLNLGVFGGYTVFGRYRQRLESKELKDLSKIATTFGGFFSASTAALDSSATTAGKLPFGGNKKATIGVVSVGIGMLFTIYNFQIGAFAGVDKGVGTNAKNWNFNNRPWIGFGIGYNLKSIFYK